MGDGAIGDGHGTLTLDTAPLWCAKRANDVADDGGVDQRRLVAGRIVQTAALLR